VLIPYPLFAWHDVCVGLLAFFVRLNIEGIELLSS
jgi:hypothetical protein